MSEAPSGGEQLATMSEELRASVRLRPRGGFWRWQWDALRETYRQPRPSVSFQPVPHAVARPRGAEGELRVTWVGHATVLLQTAGANVLLDPVWSRRASPFQWAGPERHAPPGVPFDELPPIDAVLVSHDHYDHLDRLTIKALARERRATVFVTPRGYRSWLLRRGVRAVVELGWWGRRELAGGWLGITAVPVRHWTRRSPFSTNHRLWCAYLIEAGGFRAFFCGDSGWFDGLRAVGERVRPLDLTILPIGAYEPRWFMRDHHMNPEEAVLAYRALGGIGLCMGVHWGTFVLTDEPLDEPPGRMRSAWRAAGLEEADLWIPRHGETRVLARRAAGEPTAVDRRGPRLTPSGSGRIVEA